MDDGGMSFCAVEQPKPRVVAEPGRRRHRRLTVSSGLLLFACMFLPAVKGCSAPVYPFEAPVFLHPYLYGFALALAAGARTTRGVRIMTGVLRALGWLALAGGATCLAFDGAAGVILTGIAASLLGAIGWAGVSEKRIAATAVLMGAMTAIWFGLWCGSGDALIGVYLGLLATLGLLAGGIVWLADLAVPQPPPIVVPRAVARTRQ
jgi:hypothetical protein